MLFILQRLAVLVLLGSLALRPHPACAQENAAALTSALQQAQAAQGTGHYGEAAAQYARATSIAPDVAELWSNRGMMELLAGQGEKAILSLKHALRLNPQLLTPTLFLGKAYLLTGKPAVAVPLLQRAHSLQPRDEEVLLTLGKAQAEAHQPRLALAAYKSAAELAPEDADAWFGVGVSALQVIEDEASTLAELKPPPVWSRALLADDLFIQGRPLEALETYRSELAKATAAQRARLVHTLQWEFDHAQALSMPANSVEALRTLVQEQSDAGKDATPVACPTSSASAKLAASSEDVIACAFWADQQNRSADLAATLLQRAPADAEALYWSIKANERIAVLALAHFEQRAAPSAATHVLVGNLYRMRRQPDKALLEYQRALAMDPHDAAALKGAVLACFDASRFEEAVTLDQTALADQPLDPELNLLMAEVLDAEQHQDREEDFLLKAQAVSPALQPRMHYLLARLEVKKGNLEEAIQQYRLALVGDKDGSIHYQLSRLYRQQGDTTAAQKTLAEAQALIHQHEDNAAIAMRDAAAAGQP